MATILLIEDDQDYLYVLSVIIERLGHKVVKAANGKEASRIFEKTSCDLVITDLLMPEKDGFETIREFGKRWPAVKIIAISGGGNIRPDFYLEMAEQIGAWHTLAKPFSRDDLASVVARALEA